MSLARHIDPEELVERLHNAHLSENGRKLRKKMTTSHLTPYGTKYASESDIPKYQLPKEGAPADTAYQLIRDELDLDGRPNLNLTSFVGTYMEPNATQLMVENLSKNLADNDEYPAMMSLHERCISILAHLWGAQKGEKAVGSATTGSSEAIHLDTHTPNIIMGANAQVALEKFARYFDVEARILPVSKESDYRLDPNLIKENIDENTIGVFVILGSTYTGHYEPVEEISKILDEYQEETGIDIPIHVDAASGGFYGLVYAGVGWIVWRDEACLPEHLVFELHYLGGTERSFTLNFSRPGAQSLEATGWYACVSDIHHHHHHRRAAGARSTRVLSDAKHAVLGAEEEDEEGETSADYVAGLPVVSFRLADAFRAQFPHIRQESWIVPNYALPPPPPPPREDATEILRVVVVRESMSLDLLDRLVADLVGVTQTLIDSDAVDLSILQKQTPAGDSRPARDGAAGKGKGKEEGAGIAEGSARIVEGKAARLADGIHRSVC
ncbi:hypothetical protein M426DRAFT_74968 [Hypoxylon sp. CI-4A]|nr:hypothetical protein M426DRAFT_74968 [Hypoxylon sp. CI-4A]